MNYLKLCQRLRSEAGLSGTGPITVADQSGEMGRVVNWIIEAYEYIQNLHTDWRFLQTSFNFPTIIANAEYTPASVSIDDLSSWVTDDLRVYLVEADEDYLIYKPWEGFRQVYQYGSSRSQTGRPTVFTVKPDESLFFFAIPDAVYTIDGQYFKKPDIMSIDTDSPVFKSNYHMAIVWKALMLYGAYAGAPDAYAHGENEYKKIARKMEFTELPKFSYGEPLV